MAAVDVRPDAALSVLPGIGPARAERLARLGLATLDDLVRLAPRRLESHHGLVSVAEARAHVGDEVAVLVTLGPFRFFRQGGRRSVLSLRASQAEEEGEGQDETIELYWFSQPWMREKLRELQRAGEAVLAAGKVVQTKKGPAIVAPRLLTNAERTDASGEPKLVPVYPSAEGLGQELLRGWIRAARERLGTLEEPLPPEVFAVLEEHGLPTLDDAIRALHEPRSLDEHRAARRRLALDGLLALEASLAASRGALGAAPVVALTAEERDGLLRDLPFEPTGAQRRVIDEILEDLRGPGPMRRLLQGDVGSGKTFVGLAAALAVARAGGQVALLAPTELLAEQHRMGLEASRLGEALAPVLLTGSTERRKRAKRLQALASGRARLAIGTHALFGDDVVFRRLDLVVIDEQQRFGVSQRRRLFERRRGAHALLMTATPIPRTLALALYSDLRLSQLDEKPPGRVPIQTHVLSNARRARVEREIARRVAEGERAFWVCPRIGEQDDEVSAAEATRARLSRSPMAAAGVELVHGRMPAEERFRALERFRAGEVHTLVATTVIEVGVDVPEASLMVVEGCERFGLAQLHQLRGRVGRGSVPSTCFFLADADALERLQVLADEADGFSIAEADLAQRGMGDWAGARQSGFNQEGLADPAVSSELVLLARRLVREHPEAIAVASEAAIDRALDRWV